jgi:hypothetical protein
VSGAMVDMSLPSHLGEGSTQGQPIPPREATQSFPDDENFRWTLLRP